MDVSSRTVVFVWLSVPFVYISPAARINDTYNQFTVINCINDAVWAYTEAQKFVMPFQPLNILAVWQKLNSICLYSDKELNSLITVG